VVDGDGVPYLGGFWVDLPIEVAWFWCDVELGFRELACCHCLT